GSPLDVDACLPKTVIHGIANGQSNRAAPGKNIPPTTKNTQATVAASHLRYNGSVGITLSDDPQLLEVALVHRNSMPALTGHYLAEILPRIDAPADAEHFVSAGKLLL
ncbi:unnamed protein product, partial [Sphacelaria rigidula]